jgi:hypothetical protein
MRRGGALIFIALNVLVTLVAGYYGWRHWQLMSDGVTTNALTVETDRQSLTGKNLANIPYRYYAAYTFADETGHISSGRQTIDRATYEALAHRAEGAPVVVYYSRSRPYVNELDPRSSRSASIVLALIALVGWGAILARRLHG